MVDTVELAPQHGIGFDQRRRHHLQSRMIGEDDLPTNKPLASAFKSRYDERAD
ncbi:hypothetical protein [Bradyrhizobium canariense]|uniref:hypothetical protein n=1 Tax=Bradyrhizobium canariense TaxID=255045 RepID=UPI0013747705|nr:hypothetical protein [Bradyrhizobium canariense]